MSYRSTLMDRSKLISEARSSKGLVGRKVAELVQTEASYIYAMEAGRRPVTDEMIRRYHEAGILGREEAASALLGDAA